MKKPLEFTVNGKPALIDLDAVLCLRDYCDEGEVGQFVAVHLSGGQKTVITAEEARPLFLALAPTPQPVNPSGL